MKWIGLLIILSTISCTSSEEIGDFETSFFDVSLFVDSLLMEDTSYDKVTREIKLNEEEEEVKVLTDADMTDIFGFLKQFNINRPRWYDKYTVTREPNMTTYSAVNEEYDVQEMKVTRAEQSISRIDILYRSKTLISSSEKKVTWLPKNKLSLQNTSTSLWSKEQKIDMSWTY